MADEAPFSGHLIAPSYEHCHTISAGVWNSHCAVRGAVRGCGCDGRVGERSRRQCQPSTGGDRGQRGRSANAAREPVVLFHVYVSFCRRRNGLTKRTWWCWPHPKARPPASACSGSPAIGASLGTGCCISVQSRWHPGTAGRGAGRGETRGSGAAARGGRRGAAGADGDPAASIPAACSHALISATHPATGTGLPEPRPPETSSTPPNAPALSR